MNVMNCFGHRLKRILLASGKRRAVARLRLIGKFERNNMNRHVPPQKNLDFSTGFKHKNGLFKTQNNSVFDIFRNSRI